jgi:TolB protein
VRSTGTIASIDVVRPDGSGLVALTSGAGDFYPAWAPDRTRIAFARRVAGSDTKHIFVMNADGSAVTQLTTGAKDDGWPAWSPDGKHIAFARESFLFVMGSDGSAVTQLTGNGDFTDGSPTWSPDGTKIAFVRFLPGEGTPGDVYVMNADGSGVKQLTHLSSVGSVSWSPDGAHLAFSTGTCCVDSQTLVSVMNADGSAARQLTKADDHAADPVWSPDGTQLAVARNSGGRGQVWLIAADGTNPRQLTNDAQASDSEPAWR